MIRKLMFGIAPALLLVGTPALAAPSWTVSEVSGDVRLSEAGRTRLATKGALLSSGATIVTSPGARAVIVRGQEFVVISPGSRLRVPAADSPNKVVQIIQEWGSALFKIEKKSTPHFGVKTPYLAAVVKGTTFTVTVGPEDARVKVTEGAVEVSTLDGGASDLVTPGSLAMVGKSDLYRLTVQGDRVKELRSGAAPVTPAAAPVAALSVKVPNEASVAKGDNRSARAEAVRIAKAIGEKPNSLAKATDGLVEGKSSSEHAQAEFNENSRSARDSKPDKGGANDTPGTPGKGEDGNNGGGNDKPDKDKPGKDDKPDEGKDDKPDKGEGGKDQPGKPADGSESGNGNGSDGPPEADAPKPDGGDKPSDKGPKPGKGGGSDDEVGSEPDESGKPSDPVDDKPSKGDKPADSDEGKADKPGKGDDGDDKADKPGKSEIEDGGDDGDDKGGGKGDDQDGDGD